MSQDKHDPFEATDEPIDEFMDEDQSFAELLEESFVKPVRLSPGQKVEAKVIKITDEWAFLDLGGKSEGYLSTKELMDKDGALTVKEGDTLHAYFLSTANNEQLFTTKLAGGEATRIYLEEAWRSGIPVEGLVEKEIKGGFEVKIAGSTRSFCPYSQMGLQRIENPAEYVGRHLSFRISEYGERGRNIIVSNRAVLEEERRKEREALKASLREGMTVKGTITSIRNFGAFVNIGAVEGLIPISEISWARVEDINQWLKVGEEVEVVVARLDWEKDRISFSLKQALPDPWEQVNEKYPAGSVHTGKVVRLTNFGAFVNLEDGVDGLIHISKLGAGKRIYHPREAVATDQVLEVKIESVDKENKRLALSLSGAEAREEAKGDEEDYARYAQKSAKSMGTLGDLLKAGPAKKK